MPSFADLPEHLAGRTRIEGPFTRFADGGRYILLWMSGAAMRFDENPALDVARRLARLANLPLLLHQGLSQRYPHASDRIHTFVLEGARELARKAPARGLRYLFHLERPGHEAPVLRWLAARAAAVVTEDVPLPPVASWRRSLARALPVPVFAVDCSCVVPMQATAQAFARAFAFRQATAAERERRLRRPWPEEPDVPAFLPDDLPFEPVDLERADIPALVAACDIDHGVFPVTATRGGGDAADARWRVFRDRHLRHYAERRNDPLDPDGTSRLSAWLHFGQISPFRVAREAAAEGSRGAAKFLDELLVWRELAWHTAFHRPEVIRYAGLPEWARSELERHARDPRPVILPRARLEAGETGDRLWDAAQKSLLRFGELHNSLRMTWGKALVQWCRTPEEAFATALWLNDRHALDGRDPNSLLGIGWCFGAFDRPFPPPRPITGTIRPRPTAVHARRIDLARLERRVARPVVADPPRVAVIGAGIAGLACARILRRAGLPVVLFDKGRAEGGRLCGKRFEDSIRADCGCPALRLPQHPVAARRIEDLLEEGVLAPWSTAAADGTAGDPDGEGERAPLLVGVPSMRAVATRLAEGAEIRRSCRIEAVTVTRGGFRLRHAAGEEGPFDWLLVAVPAPQAAALLAGLAPEIAARLSGVRFDPCLAAAFRFADGTALPPFERLAFDEGPVSLVVNEAAKPGRPPAPVVSVFASPAFSLARLETPVAEIAGLLHGPVRERLGGIWPEPAAAIGHRWRFARVVRPLGCDCLVDVDRRIGVAGDGIRGEGVASALLSGEALAGRLLGHLAARGEAPPPEPATSPDPAQGELFRA